ncbi:spore coat protein [Neobacillus notoginsengisoli]|uniref:Spore coat protein n=1 Tax=Neobacillus notoginsengisoli TaxID=1578198 RepID=A0A417YX36_9BACI|nr:spore coat protein [Neobacillus notoginsengisoli]RHW42116.1 spore coat protein [Neobacillus notoginsengisoli]
MNQFIQKMVGMSGMTDQVIASDFLISTKSGVRNLAAIIAETATPELRAALKEQLKDAIRTHTAISDYMIAKGYYLPNDLNGQFSVDLNAAETAIQLGEK